MKVLKNDMKQKEFKPVYLLCGEEAFLKKSYKKQMKEAIVGGDAMNFHSFEGKSVDLDEVISLAGTMPFFGEKRLILIEDSGWFKSGAAEALVSFLPEMPETTCILFVESEVDKRNRLYKAVASLGHVAEMEKQKEEKLAEWAAGILASAGRRIDGRTMQLFLERTGDDMTNIRMELDKLISYTEGRDTVTKKDIETVGSEWVEDKIFDMVEAIAYQKSGKALDLYEDLLTLKEPPMRILYMIVRQFNQLLQVKEMTAAGQGKREIAARLKVRDFVAGKLLSQAGRFSREQILAYIRECAEYEEAVKRGRLDDQVAVEMLIVKKI